jgi:hypothetical protein
MRDCCSSKEDTISAIFNELLQNYSLMWIVFAIITLLTVFFKYFWPSPTEIKQIHEETAKIKEE